MTDPADGEFETHDQSFQFGPDELEGLKIFLADKIRRQETAAPKSATVRPAMRRRPSPTLFSIIPAPPRRNMTQFMAQDRSKHFLCRDSPSASQTTMPICRRRQIIRRPRANSRRLQTRIIRTKLTWDCGTFLPIRIFPRHSPACGKFCQDYWIESAANHQCHSQRQPVCHQRHQRHARRDLLCFVHDESESPLANWTIVATNVFDSEGHFNCVSPIVSNASQAFYRCR